MKIILLALVIVCAGCQNAHQSLNYQRSLLRGSGDFAATAICRESNATPEAVSEIATGLIEFIQTHDPNTLTVAVWAHAVRQHVPVQYRNFAEALLDLVPPDVPINDVIAPEHLLRIEAFCKGALIGAVEYRPELEEAQHVEDDLGSDETGNGSAPTPVRQGGGDSPVGSGRLCRSQAQSSGTQSHSEADGAYYRGVAVVHEHQRPEGASDGQGVWQGQAGCVEPR